MNLIWRENANLHPLFLFYRTSCQISLMVNINVNPPRRIIDAILIIRVK